MATRACEGERSAAWLRAGYDTSAMLIRNTPTMRKLFRKALDMAAGEGATLDAKFPGSPKYDMFRKALLFVLLKQRKYLALMHFEDKFCMACFPESEDLSQFLAPNAYIYNTCVCGNQCGPACGSRCMTRRTAGCWGASPHSDNPAALGAAGGTMRRTWSSCTACTSAATSTRPSARA